MADLNVERKGPSIWPWIIGLVVLALLIWALVELFEDDETVVTDPAATVDERPAVGPAADTAGALSAPLDTFDATRPASDTALAADTVPAPT